MLGVKTSEILIRSVFELIVLNDVKFLVWIIVDHLAKLGENNTGTLCTIFATSFES